MAACASPGSPGDPPPSLSPSLPRAVAPAGTQLTGCMDIISDDDDDEEVPAEAEDGLESAAEAARESAEPSDVQGGVEQAARESAEPSDVQGGVEQVELLDSGDEEEEEAAPAVHDERVAEPEPDSSSNVKVTSDDVAQTGSIGGTEQQVELLDSQDEEEPPKDELKQAQGTLPPVPGLLDDDTDEENGAAEAAPGPARAKDVNVPEPTGSTAEVRQLAPVAGELKRRKVAGKPPPEGMLEKGSEAVSAQGGADQTQQSLGTMAGKVESAPPTEAALPVGLLDDDSDEEEQLHQTGCNEEVRKGGNGKEESSPGVSTPVKAKATEPSSGQKRCEGGELGLEHASKKMKKTEPKEKEKKLTKAEMESRVLEYMQQQNRPYNAQNIFDNLHGAVPKGQVTAMLDAMAADGRLLMKEYGKAKVFLCTQKASDEKSGQEEEQKLAEQLQELKAQLSKVSQEVAVARKQCNAIRSYRTAVQETQVLNSEYEDLQREIAALKQEASCTEEVPAEELKKVEEAHQASHKEWRRRKRMCMEIIHLFSEMSGKPSQHIIDSYGVDTDEACGKAFPEL